MNPRESRSRSCRLCSAELKHTFADLGASPLANDYISAARASEPEAVYPLHAFVCGECLLVQLEAVETREKIFSDYAYFSSYSDSWLAHCRQFALGMIDRLQLDADKQVVEVASNDGYLLQFFAAQGVRVLGIEPAANVARVAVDRGIPTDVAYMGIATADRLAQRGVRADLLVANNVLAHVPDLHDFVEGLRRCLASGGVLSMEFPHLLRLIAETQFDTIYHEHFSYFSLLTAEKVLAAHELAVVAVERLPTHGGSLRLIVRHAGVAEADESVHALRRDEIAAGLNRLETYTEFGEKVRRRMAEVRAFLEQARSAGKRVAAYGAPAKGNTLLNACRVGPELIEFTVDRSPHKQGRLLPGSRIPILAPEALREARPDYLVVLPWNLFDEIQEQTAFIEEWGGRWIRFMPEVRVEALAGNAA